MKVLQLEVFAQDKQRDRLSQPRPRNFRSQIVMASTLEPLSLDELLAMLKFRWEVASGGVRHPFTPEAVARIFDHAAGLPREATILADNFLLLAFHGK